MLRVHVCVCAGVFCMRYRESKGLMAFTSVDSRKASLEMSKAEQSEGQFATTH